MKLRVDRVLANDMIPGLADYIKNKIVGQDGARGNDNIVRWYREAWSGMENRNTLSELIGSFKRSII